MALPSPEILKVLNVAVIGPALLRIASDRKLTALDKTVLNLVGYATIAYNGYYLYNLWQQNKLNNVQQLVAATAAPGT